MACRRAVGVDVLHEFDVHIFYPLLLKRGQYCLSLHIVESFLVIDECDSEWDIIFSALLLPLLYDGGGGEYMSVIIISRKCQKNLKKKLI